MQSRRLEINGLATVAEAQRIATDFWQLHAPQGAPLGAPLRPRSPSPRRRAAAALRGSAELDNDDLEDSGDAAPMDAEGGDAAGKPHLAGSNRGIPAAQPGLAGETISSGGGRWRIEWRKRGGGRGAAQYCPPPGARLRAMVLSVADDVSAWQ